MPGIRGAAGQALQRLSRASPAPRSSSVADTIDALGFGWYQLQVFMLCAGFIVAEGSELFIASGLTNALAEEFGIETKAGRSMLMTMTFVGLALGTICSGPLGDAYGRRVPMLLGYIGVLCAAMCTYFAPTIQVIYVLRVCLGFFGGLGIPTALITISESSPTKIRGVATAAVGVAYCFGEMWAALGLRMFMPELQGGNWRLLLCWGAIPASCLLTFSMLSPVSRFDTPYWLSTKGRTKELIGALKLIGDLNNASPEALAFEKELELELGSSPPHRSVGLKEAVPVMTRYPMFVYTLVQCLCFFGKDFALYGSAVFWPLAWAQVEQVGSLLPATELFLTASLGVPGVGVAMLMVHYLPRRVALTVMGLLLAVAATFIKQIIFGESVGLVGVIIFKLCYPTLQMVTMLMPSEIFPTQIRAWGYGSVAFFGRLATLIAPSVVEYSKLGFLTVVSTLALAMVAAVWSLPETKDCALVELDAEELQEAFKDVPSYGSAPEGSKTA